MPSDDVELQLMVVVVKKMDAGMMEMKEWQKKRGVLMI